MHPSRTIVRRASALFLSLLPAVAGCGGADSPVDDGPAAGAGGVLTGASSGPGESVTSSGSAGGDGSESGGGGVGGGGGGVGGGRRVVRLLAVGDTGEGNQAQSQVADRMSEKCLSVGGCAAVMMNGDNFYDHGVQDTDDPQWAAKFEQPYDRPGLNGLPFYVVLGNHDYGPTSSGVRQAQIDYSSLPVGAGPGARVSDKWRMPSSYYDVRIGDVHLFAIDTIDFTSREQRDDMSARVAASDANWKIAFGHHPRYTSGQHFFDNPLLGLAGMYGLQQEVYCGADMFMSGHDHNLEFIDKGRDEDCPNTYFAISGAGSKLRDTFALIPRDERQVYFDDNTEGFAYLEFDGRNLLFEFIDKLGAVNFSTTITK
jgi:tartrate-resistant acid phosphatase type 5